MPHRSDPHGPHSSSASPFGRGWIPASRDIGLPSDNPASGDDLDWAALVQQAQCLTQDADVPLPPMGGEVVGTRSAPPSSSLSGGIVFTPPRIAAFLEALSRDGNVRAAALAAGVSAQTAYVRRRRDPAFAGGWEAALIIAREAAEQVLAARAIHGTAETIWFRGEAVGQRRRFDARLLLAHLARLDARAAQAAPEVLELAGRFDEMLADLIDGHDPASAADLPDPAREAFVAEHLAAAERAYRRDCPEPDGYTTTAQFDADWDAWEDALAHARDRARQSALAEWAQFQQATAARIDAALGTGEEGEEREGKAEESAPPLEIKSAPAVTRRQAAPLNRVNPVNPQPVSAARGEGAAKGGQHCCRPPSTSSDVVVASSSLRFSGLCAVPLLACANRSAFAGASSVRVSTLRAGIARMPSGADCPWAAADPCSRPSPPRSVQHLSVRFQGLHCQANYARPCQPSARPSTPPRATVPGSHRAYHPWALLPLRSPAPDHAGA